MEKQQQQQQQQQSQENPSKQSKQNEYMKAGETLKKRKERELKQKLNKNIKQYQELFENNANNDDSKEQPQSTGRSHHNQNNSPNQPQSILEQFEQHKKKHKRTTSSQNDLESFSKNNQKDKSQLFNHDQSTIPQIYQNSQQNESNFVFETDRINQSFIPTSLKLNQIDKKQATSNNNLTQSNRILFPSLMQPSFLSNSNHQKKQQSQRYNKNNLSFNNNMINSAKSTSNSKLRKNSKSNILKNNGLLDQSQNIRQLVKSQTSKAVQQLPKSSDVSYLFELKTNTNDKYIQQDIGQNTVIYKDPKNLVGIDKEQKKNDIYAKIYDHKHKDNQLDTDFSSIKFKLGQLKKEELQKSTSQILQQQNQQLQQQNDTIETQLTRVQHEKYLKNPPKRSEVQDLENWLNSMLDQIRDNDQTQDFESVYNHCQLIYSACLKELIRQIQIQCNERGQLLHKVWDAYLEILEKGHRHSQKIKKQLEKTHLQEIQKIYAMLQKNQEYFDIQIQSLEKDNMKKSKTQSLLEDSISYFKKQILNYKKELLKKDQQVQEFKFQYESSVAENIQLKMIQAEARGQGRKKEASIMLQQTQSSNANTVINPQKSNMRSHTNSQNTLTKTEFLQDTISTQNNNANNNNQEDEDGNSTKLSVVSHLLTQKYEYVNEKELTKKLQRNQLNTIYDTDSSHESDEEEPEEEFAQNQQDQAQKEEEYNKQLEKIMNINDESFDIQEQETQTDPILLSDSDAINNLVQAITLNPKLASNDNFDIISQLQEAIQEMKLADIDFDKQQQIIRTLRESLSQQEAYKNMVKTTQQLGRENSELKQETKDQQFQILELQQEIQNMRQRYQKKTNYIEAQLEMSSSKIYDLYLEKQKLETNLKQNKGNMKSLFKKLVSNQIHKSQDEEQQLVNSESDIENMDVQKADSRHYTPQESQKGSQHDILSSQDVDQIEKQQRQFLNRQKIQKKLSQFVGSEFLDQLGNDSEEDEEQLLQLDKVELVEKSMRGLEKIIHSKHNTQLRDTKKVSITNLPGGHTDRRHGIIPSEMVVKKVFNINSEAANKLKKDLLSKLHSKKPPQNTLPVISLQKFLQSVYQDIVKMGKGWKAPLHVQCYDYILQQYGLKQVAEKKLKQVITALYNYQDKTNKLYFSGLFFGLNKDNEKDFDIEYLIYIKAMKYFYHEAPIKIQNIGSQQHSYIELEQAKQYVQICFQDKLNTTEMVNLNSDIKQLCDNSTMAKNCIEFGDLMKSCIAYYSNKKEETRKHVQDIFYATDMDGNDSIELFEFELICRYVEPDKITLKQAEQLFIEEADLVNPISKERALSLSKFVNISMEKALFSYKKCEQFAKNIHPHDEEISNIQSLKLNWEERKKLIRYRFLQAQQLHDNVIANIQKLDEILKKDKIDKIKSTWLSYRILEEESRRVLLEKESTQILNDMLPIKLHMVRIVASKFEQLSSENDF